MPDPARPRPRPTFTAAKAPAACTSEASSSKSQLTIDVEDEDSFFIKNKSRDAQTWKMLEQRDEQLERKAEKSRSRSYDGESSDIEPVEAHSLPLRKRFKKRKEDISSWTKAKKIVKMLSEDSSDDDIQAVDKTPKAHRSLQSKRTDTSKQRRSRSRSGSITPPPALPIHALQNAKNLVRQTLHSDLRPPSPLTVGDDSNDAIVLDPELAKIAQAVRGQPSFSIGDSRNATDPAGPATVNIKVKWVAHPDNATDQTKTWRFMMRRHDTFKGLFEETADLAAILSDKLIVSYDGKRLFSSVTPHSLGIWAEAELEACNDVTYEYMRTYRHRDVSPTGGMTDNARESSLDPASDSDVESVSGGETFKLILRSEGGKSVTVTVRPTTKCEAIVREYLKRAGLPGKGKGESGFSLVVDGDKLKPQSEIGGADLEDGDLVEIA